jgi:putative spermidine/putrescine transport system ATP-binding protein/spermidine/putrescine transport system ATP-binding protein
MSEGRIHQVGPPEEIYAKPRDRFVASFVGDVNVMSGRLEAVEGDGAVLSCGNGRISVPRAAVADIPAGAPVDIFARPEQVEISDPGEAAFARGKVAAHVFQGGHVDLYVDTPHCSSGRLLARLSAKDVGTRWPLGAEVGIGLKERSGVCVFPPLAGSA